MDLIAFFAVLFTKTSTWVLDGLGAFLVWTALAFALVGGSAVSLALAQTRRDRSQ